jgi:hypothetical protein
MQQSFAPKTNCHPDRSAEGAKRRACPELAEGNLQFKPILGAPGLVSETWGRIAAAHTGTPIPKSANENLQFHALGFSVALAFG